MWSNVESKTQREILNLLQKETDPAGLPIQCLAEGVAVTDE